MRVRVARHDAACLDPWARLDRTRESCPTSLRVRVSWDFARLGDRFGRSKVAVAGGVFTAVWAFPMFALVNTGNTAAIWVGMSVAILGITAAYAVMAALVAGLFTVRTRYTGISLAYQFSGVVGGGLAPLLATYLLGRTHGSYVPAALLLVVMALMTASASWLVKDRADSLAELAAT